jgi:hypothetical protein
MDMSRKRITVAAVAAMLSAMVPGIAMAAGNGDEHCNFNVKTGEQHCFASLDEAVTNAEQSGKRSSTADVMSAGTANPVISGTLFDEPGYGGKSLTVYSEAPCVKNGKVEEPDLLRAGVGQLLAVAVSRAEPRRRPRRSLQGKHPGYRRLHEQPHAIHRFQLIKVQARQE